MVSWLQIPVTHFKKKHRLPIYHTDSQFSLLMLFRTYLSELIHRAIFSASSLGTWGIGAMGVA
jgi:hypothetical protein